ncbi:MAG: 16S rRNA (guanine(966)-N(2))-methyltransferase RsmD [Flavobacteriales bacterium]|nr:16S rRNA (guanine(966)-N(2))-methyltransferase RsmD [Flavobacteriales bacterium]
MRIISGKYKGKHLSAPKNLPVRPTTDFAKEALFNILGNEFELDGITVLDLFSGTGNIAYEFASRGAKTITCIDANNHCVSYIKRTAKELGFDQLDVYKNDVFQYLKKYPKQFDIIFADPPYDLEKSDEIITLVMEHQLLKPGGMLILEHDRKWDFSDHPQFVDHRRYGNVNFSRFSTDE